MTSAQSDGMGTHPLDEMRCVDCRHTWRDMDAAVNQHPVPCPQCGRGKTEPTHDADGRHMPRGWHW